MTIAQAMGLADAAEQFGTGRIDLTSRANLQIRGVSEARFPPLLARLQALGLVEPEAALEARRNIVVTPFWQAGDLTDRLGRKLLARLAELPPLPAKMGIALDTGPSPVLQGVSADFRFEIGPAGLLLRADGAAGGRPVDPGNAVDAVIELARWFVGSGGRARGRMARLVPEVAVPSAWQIVPAPLPAPWPQPGWHQAGLILGAPFGRIEASAFRRVLARTHATGVVCTPWRSFLLADAVDPGPVPGFVTTPDAPSMAVDACVGAPGCASAEVETQAFAMHLAARAGAAIEGGLHVSGCAKGCARPRRAATTLVGRGGRFDLVRDGTPWDEPTVRGLSAEDVMRLL